MSSGKIVIEMDSSQLSAFRQCESIWNYAYDQSITPVDATGKLSDAILMGIYFHSMAEEYYKDLVKRVPGNVALEKAHAVNMDAQKCQCGHAPELHIQHGDEHTKCLEVDCTCEKMMYAPFELEKPKMHEVRERFALYAFTHMGRDFVIEDEKQIELGFAECLQETDEHIYILTGRIDLYKPKLDNVEFGFADHKLQLSRKNLYHKRLQFRNYGMITGAKMAIINYCRMAKNVDKDTFSRDIIQYQPGEHEWWRGQLIKMFDRVKAAKVAGTYDRNWETCEGQYGPCAFNKICNAPRLELTTIETQYKKKAKWRPW